MQRLEYKVSFVTPAFLGNAEQVGQWRTPPFKVFSREWIGLCFEGSTRDD